MDLHLNTLFPKQEKAQKPKYFYFYPIFAALFIGFSGYFVLYPQVVSIQTNLSQKATVDETNAQLKSKLQILNAANQQQLSSQLNLLNEVVPSEKSIETILVSLENASIQSGFIVDAVSLVPGKLSTEAAKLPKGAKTEVLVEKYGVSALSIGAQGSGTLDGLDSFLKILKKSRRLFEIEEMRISFIGDNERQVTAAFTLNAFFLPTTIIVSDQTQPLVTLTQEDLTFLKDIPSFPDLLSVTVAQNASDSSGIQLGKENLFQ